MRPAPNAMERHGPAPRPIFVPAPGVRVVLASASPRRKELLAAWGLPFCVLTAPDAVEPRPEPGEAAAAYALRAAQSKAARVHSLLTPEEAAASLILAADTVVCLEGRILGKPADSAEALAMLEELAGRTHTVTSAVALHLPEAWAAPHEESLTDTARVTFAPWPRSVLAAYARTGEPDDKAGAYAVQGAGAFLAEKLIGAWSTVVGLPLAPLAALLLRRGLIFPAA